MKKLLIFFLALFSVASLCGCNRVGEEPLPQNSISYNEKGEVIKEPIKEQNAGSEAVKKADSGVKISYDVPTGANAAGLKTTVLTYYFENDKICALRVENTYDTPETANNAAKDFASKVESCKEVTVSDRTIRYYSSENGISTLSDMTRDSLKEVAETMGGTYEEF